MKRGRDHAVVGQYELDEELGHGSSGVVYGARDRVRSRRVAVKLVRRALGEVSSKHRASLAHPHLVTLHDCAADRHLAYVVMERIEGGDVSRFCTSDTRLSLDLVVSIMGRIARGLAYLHDGGVIHGDVKPANVLYNPRENVSKLADFAPMARLRSVRVATPAYLAPELICGAASSAESDQFAFGVTLYQLACGALPFTAVSLPQLFMRMVHEPHTPMRSHDAAISDALAGIVDRLLAKAPRARFPNMRAVVRALTRA